MRESWERDAAFLIAGLTPFLQHKDSSWNSEFGSMFDTKLDASYTVLVDINTTHR